MSFSMDLFRHHSAKIKVVTYSGAKFMLAVFHSVWSLQDRRRRYRCKDHRQNLFLGVDCLPYLPPIYCPEPSIERPEIRNVEGAICTPMSKTSNITCSS